MSFFLEILAIGIVFFLAVFVLDRAVLAPKRRREAEARPRITALELEGFLRSLEAAKLPSAQAIVSFDAEISALSSRIGGKPLAIGTDPSWPRGKQDSFPMAFLAQINFAELPKLEGFPTHGIVQIFTSFDANDDDGECERVIRWEPEPTSDQLMDLPEEIWDISEKNGYFSKRTVLEGLPLIFVVRDAPGLRQNWPWEENDPIMDYELDCRLPETADVERALSDLVRADETGALEQADHWIGGHPEFVQCDIRSDNETLQSLDRVVLHLGCDDDINIGDSGTLNVLIRQKDLEKRDFEQVVLTWDCF